MSGKRYFLFLVALFVVFSSLAGNMARANDTALAPAPLLRWLQQAAVNLAGSYPLYGEKIAQLYRAHPRFIAVESPQRPIVQPSRLVQRIKNQIGLQILNQVARSRSTEMKVCLAICRSV